MNLISIKLLYFWTTYKFCHLMMLYADDYVFINPLNLELLSDIRHYLTCFFYQGHFASCFLPFLHSKPLVWAHLKVKVLIRFFSHSYPTAGMSGLNMVQHYHSWLEMDPLNLNLTTKRASLDPNNLLYCSFPCLHCHVNISFFPNMFFRYWPFHGFAFFVNSHTYQKVFIFAIS